VTTESALRFPLGKFAPPAEISDSQRAAWIGDIAQLPADLSAVVAPLDEVWLERAYRPGGWTVHQVVQHLADSHTNSYVRFKWALTEEQPTIKAYDEKAWAECADRGALPVTATLAYLSALHERWVALLSRMSTDDWRRGFIHPDSGPITLDVNLGLYAWHGRHHLAHITSLLEREAPPA